MPNMPRPSGDDRQLAGQRPQRYYERRVALDVSYVRGQSVLQDLEDHDAHDWRGGFRSGAY